MRLEVGFELGSEALGWLLGGGISLTGMGRCDIVGLKLWTAAWLTVGWLVAMGAGSVRRCERNKN